jgi:hypothetical protein
MHINNLQNQPKKTQVNIIGAGGQQWVELAKETGILNKYESLRINKEIGQNIIAYENQRSETQKFVDQYYLHQLPSERKKFKFLPQEFYSPVGIQIWHDKIDLIIYSQDPIIFEIKNKDLVKSFTNYFNLLWKMAKK